MFDERRDMFDGRRDMFDGRRDMFDRRWLHIPFLRYQILCRVTGPMLYLPPLYEIENASSPREGKSVVRGRVIYGLLRDGLRKQSTCTFHNPCDSCKRGIPCDWSALFGSAVPEEAAHHFVIVPPLSLKRVYRAGEFFSFEIKLFGKSARHSLFAERFMPALEMGGMFAGIGNWIELADGHFGRFEIEKVWVQTAAQWLEIYSPKTRFSRGASPVYLDEIVPTALDSVVYREISWITPFCLKKRHEHLEKIELQELLYFILCRLSMLQENPEKRDMKPILTQAEKARLLEQDLRMASVYQGRDNLFRVGKILYDAIPSELLPFLIAGSIVHLGKETRYGNGSYILFSET